MKKDVLRTKKSRRAADLGGAPLPPRLPYGFALTPETCEATALHVPFRLISTFVD